MTLNFTYTNYFPIIRFIFLLFLISVQRPLPGQQSKYKFDRYSVNEGLSGRFIDCIYQDKKGFIWIGASNGLTRFNGISFKTYEYDPDDSTSIPGNEVKALTEDSLGNLWILTNSNFCIYNRKTDNFIRKSLRVKDTVYSNHFISCFIDSKGYMWLGSYGKINRFKLYGRNLLNNKYIDAERYVLKEPDLTCNRTKAYSFTEDRNAKVWLASYSKFLFCFDEKKKEFVPYTVNHPEESSFSNKLKNMIVDKDGNFIITIEDGGILVWNRLTNRFDLYKSDKKNHKGPNDNIIFAMAAGPENQIWIGGQDTGGINIFDTKNKTFSYIKHNSNDSYSPGTNKIHSIYRDRSGNMWVGLNNQLNKFSPQKQMFTRYCILPNSNKAPCFDNTLCFTESKTGDIWIGYDGGGLSRYNPKTGTFKHYKNIPGNKRSLSSNSVVCLCEDHEGTLWIGTFNGGLCSFRNGKFTTYMPDPKNPHSIAYHHIWYIYEDSRNNLWVASLSNGLDLFDRKNKKFYHYNNIPEDKTSLSCDALMQIYEDKKQNIYLTTHYGLSVFNLNDYDFTKPPPKIKFKNLFHDENKNSLSSNSIHCVTEDHEGNLWFGNTATGLDKYDVKTKKYYNYSTKEGLPGNYIATILFDNDDQLWLTTNDGLARFNPVSKEIKLFDREDGLAGNSFHGWSVKTSTGRMFICSTEGFNTFNPEKIQYNNNPPEVYITGLKVYNTPVKPFQKINNRVILKEDILETKELVLSYQEDFFSLEFVALDYTSPFKNQYAYKLENFNKEWIYCGTNREAIYTNLDPGEYIFKVKASNNDGKWNEQGAQLKITVLPPWWGAIWFKTLIFIVAFWLIILFFYVRLTNYRKRQSKLTQLVKIRTEELERSNRNLMEQQLQIEEQTQELIIYADHLKETNNILTENQKLIEEQSQELKHKNEQLSTLINNRNRLISIIGHDLRNPFNAILGFSDLLLERYHSLTSEKALKYIGYIKDSAWASNNLLENLLNWSRAQSGNIKFEPVVLDLKNMIKESIKLLSGSAQQKDIQIQLLVQHTKIFVDENMIKTVFRNLMTNAIKFTGKGGRILVTSTQKDTCLEISIADTGIGIPEEERQRLFQLAEHVSTKGTSNESGTGLGLLICKEFIEKNGGTIRVESKVGMGSTFYFTIPNKNP